MPDFTMCTNQECIHADMCERFTAVQGRRQSFAYFSSINDRCDWFMPNEKYKAWEILSQTKEQN